MDELEYAIGPCFELQEVRSPEYVRILLGGDADSGNHCIGTDVDPSDPRISGTCTHRPHRNELKREQDDEGHHANPPAPSQPILGMYRDYFWFL